VPIRLSGLPVSYQAIAAWGNDKTARGASLADEDEWRCFAFPLEPPQRSQFIASERMSAGGAILDPADVEDA